MQKAQKQKLLGILILVCILMMILGVSLSALRMQPGEFFLPQLSDEKTSNLGRDVGDFSWFIVVIRGFQIILLILLPIYIVTTLLSKRGWRKLLSDILKIAIFFLITMWVSDFVQELTSPDVILEQQSGSPDFSEILGEGVVPPSFEANPQPWMLTSIIIGAAVLVAVITFFGLKYLVKPKPVENPQFQEFADMAQVALDDIEAANIEFDDVIIRCYAEMSQTLQAEKNIQRAQAMTPQEFVQELLAKGFPSKPVEQLTHLFEQVRYGRQQLGEDAKQVATESLREIIDFCRGQP